MSQLEKKNDIQICPECQKENKSHYNFCIYCGKQLKLNPVIRDYKSLA
jgi:predicted amidophosphoribosyltransferase